MGALLFRRDRRRSCPHRRLRKTPNSSCPCLHDAFQYGALSASHAPRQVAWLHAIVPSRRQVPTNRSAKALARRARAGVRVTRMPPDPQRQAFEERKVDPVRQRLIGHLVMLTVCAQVLLALSPLTTGAMGASGSTGGVNSELPWHSAVVDAHGKLLAWYKPKEQLGYDQVLRLGWHFIEHKVPDQPGTKLKTYLVNSVFNGGSLDGAYWQSNPAMTFGSFVDSALAWYPYSGDREAIRTVGAMLNYELAHGTTPATWSWPSVPFSTGCGNQPEYGRCLSDMPKDFYGGIEPDKVGELGIGYVLYYEMTGNRTYLKAAIHCADGLAAHVRSGDDGHTPWPFRVDARTGATLDGEEFGGIVVSPLRLFDELIRIRQGHVKRYVRARHTAWGWLLSHQLNPRSGAYDDWSGYFEDVPKDANNVNQAAATYTALYLLHLPDPTRLDPEWQIQVGHLIGWVQQHFGAGPFDGAWGINEQGPANGGHTLCCSLAGLGSDTARWAAVNALYYEKIGDAVAKENAFESLNYSTYFASSDGRISCCGQSLGTFQYWFSDGYSDYLRSFNWAMASIPSLAPSDQSHLLGSTSVVQKVLYGHKRIAYRTFDAESTEVLRLNFRPRTITSGGHALSERRALTGGSYTLLSLPGGGFVLRLEHVRSNDVQIAA